MKNILIFILLVIVSFQMKAQSPTFPTPSTGGGLPIKQFLGSDSTLIGVRGIMWAKYGIVHGIYTDTTQANTTRIKQYPGAEIYTSTGNKKWLRNSTATTWLDNTGGGSTITDIDIINDSTWVICYSDGSCDTTTVEGDSGIINIYNNSIVNISIVDDSCLSRCTGLGICDTVCTNFTITSWEVLSCSTVAVVGYLYPDSITVLYDTLDFGECIPVYIFQNWLRQTSVGIHEFGSNSEYFSPGLMLSHNTYTNTNYFKMRWDGYTVYDAPHTFYQQQSFQNSTAATAWWHRGNPQVLGTDNDVKMYINYSDSIYSAGVEGYFGNAVGYSFGANWQGHGSFGTYLDNNNSKSPFVFFHTKDSSTLAGVTIGAAPDLGGTPPVLNGNLKNYKTATFNTDGSVQFNRYTLTNFRTVDTTTYKPTVIDANGNLRTTNWIGAGGGTVTDVTATSPIRITGVSTVTPNVVADTARNANFLANHGRVKQQIDSLGAVKQNLLKLGNDHTFTGDSLFLRGAWVNLIDYGGNPDGVTNNNAALTAAIATGKNIFVPRGRYVISAAIQLQAGQTIFGVGYNSVFKTSANDRILWTNSNTTISGLRFVGSGKGAGLTFQTGIFAAVSVKFDISHCWFDSLSGAPQQNGGGGIVAALYNGSSQTEGGRISNCTFYNNNGGLVMLSRSEYTTITNITCSSNTVGIAIGAGNITVSNAIVVNNGTGVLVFEGTNDGHGVFANSLVNHNDTTLSVRDITHDVGFQFTNSDFYYGKMAFLRSANIRFTNCNFDQLDSVSINGSTGLARVNCWWGKTQGGNRTPVNIFNGGQDFATVGEMRYDDSSPNYWINQKYADTVLFAGQFYLTGIPSGGVAADSVLVATSTGQVKKRDAASFGGTYTASNGLNLDGSDFQLGGTLGENTLIALDGFNLDIQGSSSTTRFDNTGVVGIGISSSYTATRLNVVDNSVGANNIVSITSTSTAAASDLQKGLNVALSGANSNNGENTYGIYSSNTHTGTTSQNFGVYGIANGGTFNYGVYGESDGWGVYGKTTNGTAMYADAVSGGIGMQANSTTGTALRANTTDVGGLPLSVTAVSSTTNTALNLVRITRTTSGTAADGIGASIRWDLQADDGSTVTSNSFVSVLTTAAVATTTSQLMLTGRNSGVSANIISFEGNKRTMLYGRLEMQQGADVASVAGAIAVGLDGNSFELTGTNAVTLISNLNWVNGSEITLLFTSTATLTDGTANSGTDIGMELAGNANFVGSAGDVVTLILAEIGSVQRWYEKSRSVN